jgi:hypothetical protein
MARRFIILTCLLIILSPGIFSQVSTTDSLLLATIRKYGQASVMITLPDRITLNELSRNVSIRSVSKGTVGIVLSARTVDWFLMQKTGYTLIEDDSAKGIKTAADINEAMAWESYPTYSQYVTIMQDFQTLYPSLCNLDTIGTSINGKLVLVLKISDNVKTDEDEPEVLYTSSIHGDETGGFILMMRLAEYLLTNYNSSSRVRELVNNLEIWINPLANPDGTYRTGNIMTSPVRENAAGYDLNRNFPDPDYNPPNKQKETLDMVRFMRKHKFILSANFHSGEEVVNYPWDRWSRLHADDNWFHYISRKYADTTHIHSPLGYMTYLENGVTNGWDWYAIWGGRQDFVTYELHGREVTIELDDYYVTPANQLNTLWESNWRSLIGYLENALYGIHGSVKNALTGSPVPAKIFIEGHDKDSSYVFSDTLTGSFVRMLFPGTWNLTFSAADYNTRVVKNVVVTKDHKTLLNVGMIPLGINTTDQMTMFPNPVTELMRVLLPKRQIGRVKINIFDITGLNLDEHFEETIDDVPLNIDTKGLAGGTYILVITNTKTGTTDKGRFVVIK